MQQSKRVIYDVTLDISNETPVFPGDPGVIVTPVISISDGAIANVSNISIGSHMGTHIDAPKHFFESGNTIDNLPIDCLVGTARVIEVPEKDFVSAQDLKPYNIKSGEIIILKTRNSSFIEEPEFNTGFVYLSRDGAEYLVNAGVKTVGIDYLSIEEYESPDSSVHKILLSNNIVIIEGLKLKGIKQGMYEIAALPLKIKGCDGSPARVILINNW